MGAAYKSLCTAALIQMLLGLGYSQYQTWESTRLHCMFLTFCPTCESFGFSSFFRVSIKESSVAKLGSVCRRIYRIFSHAYFHHRQIFDEYENETFLCHRFTKFVMKYNLMSKDNLIVPILEEEVQNSVSGESEA